MIDEVIDQLLLVRRLPPGELEEPGHRDVARMAGEEHDRLTAERRVRRIRRERRADRAFVAVVAVGRADPRGRRVLARQLVGGDDQRRGQAVAHLVQAGQHDAQPGVAALGMADDQEIGASCLGQLQTGERSPARRHAPPRGQDRGRRQHRPFLHAITDLQHDKSTATSLERRCALSDPSVAFNARDRRGPATSSRGRGEATDLPCRRGGLPLATWLVTPPPPILLTRTVACQPRRNVVTLASTKRIRGIAGRRPALVDQGGWR